MGYATQPAQPAAVKVQETAKAAAGSKTVDSHKKSFHHETDSEPSLLAVQKQMNKHHKRKSMLKSNINITAAPVAYVAPVTGAVPVAGAASNYPAVAAAYQTQQSQQPQQPQQASQAASAKQLLPI